MTILLDAIWLLLFLVIVVVTVTQSVNLLFDGPTFDKTFVKMLNHNNYYPFLILYAKYMLLMFCVVLLLITDCLWTINYLIPLVVNHFSHSLIVSIGWLSWLFLPTLIALSGSRLLLRMGNQYLNSSD